MNTNTGVAAWITRPMLITFALLVSLPLWIDSVGLYQYLGVEIVIWMVFALASICCSAIPACLHSGTALTLASVPMPLDCHSYISQKACGWEYSAPCFSPRLAAPW